MSRRNFPGFGKSSPSASTPNGVPDRRDTRKQTWADKVREKLPPLAENEYEVLWERGVLGVIFLESEKDGVPYVSKATESCISSRVCQGDVLKFVNVVRSKDHSFSDFFKILATMKKPVLLRFQRSSSPTESSGEDSPIDQAQASRQTPPSQEKSRSARGAFWRTAKESMPPTQPPKAPAPAVRADEPPPKVSTPSKKPNYTMSPRETNGVNSPTPSPSPSPPRQEEREEYQVQWESGSLGLFFGEDRRSNLPVVTRATANASPAVQRSVAVNDTLISANGLPSSQHKFEEFFGKLQQMNKPVRLVFRRARSKHSDKRTSTSVKDAGSFKRPFASSPSSSRSRQSTHTSARQKASEDTASTPSSRMSTRLDTERRKEEQPTTPPKASKPSRWKRSDKSSNGSPSPEACPNDKTVPPSPTTEASPSAKTASPSPPTEASPPYKASSTNPLSTGLSPPETDTLSVSVGESSSSSPPASDLKQPVSERRQATSSTPALEPREETVVEGQAEELKRTKEEDESCLRDKFSVDTKSSLDPNEKPIIAVEGKASPVHAKSEEEDFVWKGDDMFQDTTTSGRASSRVSLALHEELDFTPDDHDMDVQVVVEAPETSHEVEDVPPTPAAADLFSKGPDPIVKPKEEVEEGGKETEVISKAEENVIVEDGGKAESSATEEEDAIDLNSDIGSLDSDPPTPEDIATMDIDVEFSDSDEEEESVEKKVADVKELDVEVDTPSEIVVEVPEEAEEEDEVVVEAPTVEIPDESQEEEEVEAPTVEIPDDGIEVHVPEPYKEEEEDSEEELNVDDEDAPAEEAQEDMALDQADDSKNEPPEDMDEMAVDPDISADPDDNDVVPTHKSADANSSNESKPRSNIHANLAKYKRKGKSGRGLTKLPTLGEELSTTVPLVAPLAVNSNVQVRGRSRPATRMVDTPDSRTYLVKWKDNRSIGLQLREVRFGKSIYPLVTDVCQKPCCESLHHVCIGDVILEINGRNTSLMGVKKTVNFLRSCSKTTLLKFRRGPAFWVERVSATV